MFNVNNPIYDVTFTRIQKEEPLLAINSPGWNKRRDRLIEQCSGERLTHKRTVALELDFDPRQLEPDREERTHGMLIERMQLNLPLPCRRCKKFDITIRHFDKSVSSSTCKVQARGACLWSDDICPDGYSRAVQKWRSNKIDVRNVSVGFSSLLGNGNYATSIRFDRENSHGEIVGDLNNGAFITQQNFEYRSDIPGYLGRQQDPIYLDKQEEKIIRAIMRERLPSEAAPKTPNSGTW